METTPSTTAAPAARRDVGGGASSAVREVTLRFASPDVIHGVLVTGADVNTMVAPGYVSQVHTVFRTTGGAARA